MKITLQIASPPDHENIVVELWFENIQLAEVSNENGVVEVELYQLPGAPDKLPLDDFLTALQTARSNLT